MAAITRVTADARPVNDYLSVELTMDVATLAGQAVYVKSNGRGALADADAAGTMKAIGVATMDCAAGRAVAIVTYGKFGGWTGMTPGTTPFVGGVAGELDTAAGTVSQKIGTALSATEILINPEV
jgi:hypothetical protein